MTFGGDKTKIGTFEWVTNVTVDGKDAQAHSQVIAGYPTTVRGWNGEMFTGFVLVGGISYPGGSLIVQDPSVSSQATLNIGAVASADGSGSTDSSLHLFQFGLLLVGSIIVIGLVLAAILIRKRPKHPAGLRNAEHEPERLGANTTKRSEYRSYPPKTTSSSFFNH